MCLPTSMRSLRSCMIAALALFCALAVLPSFAAPAAASAGVAQFSPQGTVRDVRQVSAGFAQPMIEFGDARAADPFDIDCPAPGHGRWVDTRNWVYDFDADLPAGLRCRFTLKSALRSLDGSTLGGSRSFSFDTGGPAVRASLPSEGARLDEQQVFLLALDATADAASIAEHGYCAVQNLAERLPLVVLAGSEREAVLEQRRQLGYAYYRVLWKDGDSGLVQVTHDALRQAEQNIVAVRCARPLPNDAQVDLVWGAGIRSPSGIATTQDQLLRFQVRPAFSASFSCQRVNASAPCIPVLPMSVQFSAPVAREQALAIRLQGDRTHTPTLDDDSPQVEQVTFKPPFAPSTQFSLQLPEQLTDDAGRMLLNASSFPLQVETDAAPALAKFDGEFGILELKEGGVLPVTLRALEDQPFAASLGGSLGGSAKRIDSEAEVLHWMQRVEQAMRGEWTQTGYLQPGRSSVFTPEDGAAPFQLPEHLGGKAFEVIGIPLKTPGLHVVEIASPVLGAALLGEARPRYVATTALVTNLGVHFKWGREGSLVFVTRLDDGRPVADAQLRIVDACDARTLWEGRSGDDGIARIAGTLPTPNDWTSCDSDTHPLMVSARSDGDFSFTLTQWNKGISPYDFQLPVASWEAPQIAHSVLDRSLLRAGETLSMKHYWREHTAQGSADSLRVPAQMPDTLFIDHAGSGESVELPLKFDAQGIAESQWQIPVTAKLGEYTLRLAGKDFSHNSGSFRVEQFRVPLMRAQIQTPAQPAVAVSELPLDLFVGYFSGGGAGGLPVKLRSQLRPYTPQFAAYEDFSFDGQTIREGVEEDGSGGYFPTDEDSSDSAVQPARTLPLTLDASGAAHIQVPDLTPAGRAQQLVAELEYPDANGELASVRTQTTIWPAQRVVGIATDGWSGSSEHLHLRIVALDLDGKPVRGQKLAVTLYARKTHSYRKRLVGGFYAWSHSTQTQRIDAACSGRSDAYGLLHCELEPGVSGEVLAEATTQDDEGRIARAVTSVWLSGKDEQWFAQSDSDRMDLIPEQREVQPGESARLQVRMPFRRATALVSIEREGVLDAHVVELSGRDPVIEVPMAGHYAPNVYVSVLALRPRVSDFRSRFNDFLRWLGLDRWLRLDGASPTAMTDLSRPAFRLGTTRVDVGWAAHRLQVAVQPQQDTYKTRATARVEVQVRTADSRQVPKAAEIAFAAVDEALLDLHANPSVNLLDAMMQRRGIEVFTSTAQMQVVGKRHYGRKSLPPGGGGGRGAPRELLDSLLLWKGRVPLDADGRAQIDVPLNDALSSFRLTAIASAGSERFGTGSATIRTTQDVQLLSGLAPLARSGDRYRALYTVRNTTAQALPIELTASVQGSAQGSAGQPLLLNETRKLQLAANSATTAAFALSVPDGMDKLQWTLQARAADGTVLDALKVQQTVIPAVPVRVRQATLLQLEPGQTQQMPVAMPADALPGRGGIRVQLESSLTASLDPLRAWMRDYPYICYEQQASRAIALDDRRQWDALMAQLPGYLDRDGLIRYFPSPWLEGSDTLTAYVVAIAAEAGWEIPQAERERMLRALENFVQGRIQRGSPLQLTDQTERRLAAMDALSRHGRGDAAWLSNLSIAPQLWPSSALIDWIGILGRLDGIPQRETLRAQALQILRSRLNLQGTLLGFSAEQDDALWWLMISADVNANRAVLALLDDATQWPGDGQTDLPRLMRGALSRQQQGHWNLTTANAWGALALNKFAARFEAGAVSGRSRAVLGAASVEQDWSQTPPHPPLDLPWPSDSEAGRQPALAHAVGEGGPLAQRAVGEGERPPAAVDPGTGRRPDQPALAHAVGEGGPLAQRAVGEGERPPAAVSRASLDLTHVGAGKPWAVVQSLAAIPLREAQSSGYHIQRSVEPVEQQTPGRWTRGDVLRVKLAIDAQSDMSWVVVDDPIPAGATLLGSGLGRDSQLLTQGEQSSGDAWPAYEERRFDGYRAYYAFVPKGSLSLEYTLRLNTAGDFQLPPTRVEAMYAPEMFGELPLAPMQVNDGGATQP